MVSDLSKDRICAKNLKNGQVCSLVKFICEFCGQREYLNEHLERSLECYPILSSFFFEVCDCPIEKRYFCQIEKLQNRSQSKRSEFDD